MYLFENGKVKELTNQNKVLFSRLLNAPIRKLLEERTDGLFLVQDFYPCSAGCVKTRNINNLDVYFLF